MFHILLILFNRRTAEKKDLKENFKSNYLNTEFLLFKICLYIYIYILGVNNFLEAANMLDVIIVYGAAYCFYYCLLHFSYFKTNFVPKT